MSRLTTEELVGFEAIRQQAMDLGPEACQTMACGQFVKLVNEINWLHQERRRLMAAILDLRLQETDDGADDAQPTKSRYLTAAELDAADYHRHSGAGRALDRQ